MTDGAGDCNWSKATGRAREGRGLRCLEWDGTFYRDLARYGQSGALFWSAYLKPGSGPGNKNGYWFNFGSGWCHLANDDPAQILTGASQRLFYNVGRKPSLTRRGSPQTPHGAAGGTSAGSCDPAYTAGYWNLVIEATMFVTYAVVNVWTGVSLPATILPVFTQGLTAVTPYRH